jgi:hypothetical protein
MADIDKVSKIVQGIIQAAIVVRIIWCAVSMGMGGEEAMPSNKKKLKNAIVFLAISILAFTLKDLVIDYFGEGGKLF